MTFYFYDVETSGFNPRTARIMQFGGQRTDKNLKPIGQPDNILIKMTPDILPEPDAVLVHGISPQQTISEGLTEAEFLRFFIDKISLDDTVFVGYNNIRFDDEFMRFALWRNFYDAYEWQWKNGRSRWDLLDVVRMTRALRHQGINWPYAPDGKASNRLELIASVNKLTHTSAHDALSDVHAVIAVARMIKEKQPKLFDYLFNLRDKKKVEALVTKGVPLVYTSGRYPSEYEKTTIAVTVAQLPDKRGALMYDLRTDPAEFIKMTPAQLAERWQARGDDVAYFPVKLLSYNKSPAIAPISVLKTSKSARLKLDPRPLKHLPQLQSAKDFGEKLVKAWELMQPKKQTGLVADQQKVDELLYDGFIPDTDKTKISAVRAADADKLSDLKLDFADQRLKLLLPLYKARNFPKSLSQEEQEWWEVYRQHRLLDGGDSSRAARYFKRISELSSRSTIDSQGQYLLDELNLYGQSAVPLDS